MKIGAHRGAFNDPPKLDENSLTAFQRAIEFGCDYIELDVHKTTDGKFVVHHDPEVKIQGKKIKIKESTSMFLEENVRLPMTGEIIPYLDVVMKLCRGKIKVNIEIKDPEIGSEVCSFLESLPLSANDYCISSFHEKVLQDISKSHPDIKLGFLFYKSYFSIKPVKIALKYHCVAINPLYRILTNKLINESFKNQLEINIWTVNGEKNLTKFLKHPKITSVITNDVELALRIKKNQTKLKK